MYQLIIEAKIVKSKKSWLEQLIHLRINDVIRKPQCSSLTHIIYNIHKNQVSVDLLLSLKEFVRNDERSSTVEKINLLKKLEKLIILHMDYESKSEISFINSIEISDIIDYFLF
jgi:hypothetical protein